MANLPPRGKGKSRDIIGKALNVGGRSLSDAKVVTNEGTPEEIAEAVGTPRRTVSDFGESFLKQVSPESGYGPPIYNVWE